MILRGKQWNTPDELASLPIHSPLAGVQTIGELTNITRTAGPTQLRRVDGKRTISYASFTTPARYVAGRGD